MTYNEYEKWLYTKTKHFYFRIALISLSQIFVLSYGTFVLDWQGTVGFLFTLLYTIVVMLLIHIDKPYTEEERQKQRNKVSWESYYENNDRINAIL